MGKSSDEKNITESIKCGRLSEGVGCESFILVAILTMSQSTDDKQKAEAFKIQANEHFKSKFMCSINQFAYPDLCLLFSILLLIIDGDGTALSAQ